MRYKQKPIRIPRNTNELNFLVRFQQICMGKRCMKKKCSEDEDCPARSKCHPTNKICRGNRYLG